MDSSTRWGLFLLRLLIFALVAGILATSGLIAKTAFFEKSTTPRTAAERLIMDAEQSVKTDPRSDKARVALGKAYAAVGRYVEAIGQFKIAIKLNSKNPEAYLGLGFAYNQRGDLDAAIGPLKTAIASKEALGQVIGAAWSELGQVYLKQKNYGKAVEALDQAATYTDDVGIIMDLAGTYEKMGDKKSAIREYRKVLGYVPDYKEAQQALKRLGAQ